MRCPSLALLLGLPAAALAQPAPTQTWRGLMLCDAMPGITTIPLRQRLEVHVTAGQASYRREVFVGDTTQSSGVPETGGGPVSANGAVTLTGQASGRGYTYSAAYAGVLPPAGGQARFAGTQRWLLANGRQLDRPCTLELAR